MKKLIAILTIAIVLVGAVFAADTAGLTISVEVPEYVPTFKLGTSDTTNVTTQFFDAVVTEDSVSYTAGSLNDTAASTLANATSNLVVRFGIFQVKPTNSAYIKTEHKYTFTADASDLILNVTTNNVTAPKEGALANEKFTKNAVSNITGASTKPAATYATVTDGNGTVQFSIDYLGVKYIPATDEVEIGNFTVTWNSNDTAVPGTYTANIWLTMTTS